MTSDPGDYVIVFIVLICALVYLWCAQSDGGGNILTRILATHDAEEEQFRADYQAGIADGGKDHLEALVEATREQPDAEVADFAYWEAEYQRHRAEQLREQQEEDQR